MTTSAHAGCPAPAWGSTPSTTHAKASSDTSNATPNTCFVDEQEGTITGAILAGHDGRRGYIYHTAVNPAYRHQGIGTALVNAALHALANEGIIKVALVVFSRNDAGNAFWERLGFTARGDLAYRNKALCAITRIDT